MHSKRSSSASQAQTKCDPTTVQPPLKRALNTAQAQPECAPIVTQAATKHSPKCEEGMISKQLQPLRLAKFHYRFPIPKYNAVFQYDFKYCIKPRVAVCISRYKFQTRSDGHRAKRVRGTAGKSSEYDFRSKFGCRQIIS